MQCCRPRKWYSQILSLICTLLSPIQNLFVLWYSVSSKESNTVFRTKLRLGSNPKKAYRSNCRLRILSFCLFKSIDGITFAPAVWSIAELCGGATLWGIKRRITTCIKQDIHHCVSCFLCKELLSIPRKTHKWSACGSLSTDRYSCSNSFSNQWMYPQSYCSYLACLHSSVFDR